MSKCAELFSWLAVRVSAFRDILNMTLGFKLAPQHRVFAVFFLYAFGLAGIFSRLADIQLRMGIEEGALGFALIGTALGVQIALMFAGPLIEKIGHRNFLLLAIPALAFLMAAGTFAQTPLWLFINLVFSGLFVGSTEIIINLEADRVEYLLKRRIMNRAHAFWSFGFFGAGLTGMAMTFMQVSPSVHLIIVAIVLSAVTFVLISGLEPAPHRPSEGGPAPKFVRPSVGILLLVTFTLSAMLMEGAAIDWSVIFMRDVFGTPQFINIMAFALGSFTQAVTRFFADRYVDRFGPTKVSRAMILILGIGTASVVFSQFPAMGLLGFALIGIGSSGLFPLAMSAAAQRTDRPASINVAALAQLSFLVFLLAPPILGFVAEHLGIRFAFGIGLPFVLFSWLTVNQLMPPEEKTNG